MAYTKITIIGAGSVGATTAFAIASQNLADEMVIIDIKDEKAKGEALDIYQCTPLFGRPANIYAGDYEAARGSDLVVITSGLPRKVGQTRLELTQTNVNILKSIAVQISKTCPDATYIIVSNPVDILTYAFSKITGIPEERVIGTGTLLDTVRLRARIAEKLSISQKNVHAYVFGEHGDTSFVPWSIAEISTINIQDYKDLINIKGAKEEIDFDEAVEYVRTSGSQIIKRKGCTNYGIAMTVCEMCRILLAGSNTIVTASNMMHGEYGIEDVCLSTPLVIGNGKVQGRVLPKLTEEEMEKLKHSSETLKAILAEVDFSLNQ